MKLINKQTTEAVIYKYSIKEMECTKRILSELDERSKTKSSPQMWKELAKHVINGGTEIIFVHVWDTEEAWPDGTHHEKQMVFKIYIGFASCVAGGLPFKYAGMCSHKDIESLRRTYEDNPDRIFKEMDYDEATEETIIDDLLNEFLKFDVMDPE